MHTSKDTFELDPVRWGLPLEAVEGLGEELYQLWERFHDCFTTRRHDTSNNAFIYLKGLMLLPNKRNYANIARSLEVDEQNLQHFMSESPWSASSVFDQIHSEIRHDRRLQGGMLTLDESGDVRSGDKSAGAARQYIGNVGKIQLGQVGVALGYYAADVWALVDAELFLPEVWFDKAHKAEHQRLHIPEDRQFQKKSEIGLMLIDRAIENGLPFTRLSSDTFYGRDHDFRYEINRRFIPYLMDIPCHLRVYLQKPQTGIPKKGKRGPKPKRWQVLNRVETIEVRQIIDTTDITFHRVDIRPCERGMLYYQCAKVPVWTITSKGKVQKEVLFIRKEADGQITYSLSNQSATTPLKTLAQWRSERYFTERTFQDAKSEGGWDELVAQKYRAWMHHTALDALALWFVAQVKLNFREKYPPDERLKEHFEIDKLPALSMANVRKLLQAVMPLKQLNVEESIQLVIKHLTNRANSTKSRKKAKLKKKKPT